MTAAVVSVTLSEWQTLTPADSPDLAGLSFDLTGEYQSAFLVMIGMLGFGIIVLTQARVGRVRPVH